MTIRLVTAPRILLVAPCADWGDLESPLADRGYELMVVRDVADARRFIHLKAPTLVVAAMDEGMELLRRGTVDGQTLRSSVILVAGSASDDEVVVALEAGADDVLCMPLSRTQVLARVNVQIRHGARLDTLRQLSERDELTGARNRRGTLHTLNNELVRAQRSQTTLSILAIDLDSFKLINDTHGHAAGDAVLIDVVRRASGLLRRTDTVGRMGGDEFLVILPEAGAAEANEVACRLREAVARIAVPNSSLNVGVSIGIVACEGGTMSSTALLEAADQRMYWDKQRYEQLAIPA